MFGAGKTPVSADEEWAGSIIDVGHLLVFGVLGNKDWRPIIRYGVLILTLFCHTPQEPQLRYPEQKVTQYQDHGRKRN